MWNLNYPTKGNLNPCPLDAWNLNPWAPTEVPKGIFLNGIKTHDGD